MLVIYPSMKDDLLCKVLNERFSIHIVATPLYGIEHINAQIDHIREDVGDRAIAVKEDKNARVVSQIDDAFHAGE